MMLSAPCWRKRERESQVLTTYLSQSVNLLCVGAVWVYVVNIEWYLKDEYNKRCEISTISLGVTRWLEIVEKNKNSPTL